MHSMDEPEKMSPEERFEEIAATLAARFLRLKTRGLSTAAVNAAALEFHHAFRRASGEASGE